MKLSVVINGNVWATMGGVYQGLVGGLSPPRAQVAVKI